jgi:hypothetical protein
MIIRQKAGKLRPPGGLCHHCAHFQWNVTQDGCWSCTAYPEGIPYEISNAQVDHRYPYDDDQDIQFLLREGQQVHQVIERNLLDNRLRLLRGFQRMWMHHQQARQAYATGEIDQEQLLNALSDWLLMDWVPNHWTIGKNDRWYRLISMKPDFYDEFWVEAAPPFPMETITSSEHQVSEEFNDERLFYEANYDVPSDIEADSVRRLYEIMRFERSEMKQRVKTFLQDALFENDDG